MDILIAGGGIGGLTTAICLAQAGHAVQVFEQAPKIEAVGAGIQLSPNAINVLRKLDLNQEIIAKGFQPQAVETRIGITGRSVFHIPISDHWDAPYIHIHRAALIEILRTALLKISPSAIQLNKTAQAYEQEADDVTLVLTDGTRHKGDIVVGADGIHSVIREQMLGPDEPCFTGNVAWRAVIPKDKIKGELPPPTACAWMGPGRHAVTYHLNYNLINFVGVVEQDDWQIESWTEQGDRANLMRDYADWHPIIKNIIEAITPNELYRWALFDRPPLCQWTNGRVALLGDSAHPMLPFLAQGAAMAIEDGFVLAREISRPDTKIGDALNQYQIARYQRASRVQEASRNNMKTFHRKNRLSQLATYGPMWLGGRFTPGIVRGRMDWIYKGGPT